MDYNLPGCSVHGIFQARILEGFPISFSRDLPNPGIEPMSLASPALASKFFTTAPPSQVRGHKIMCPRSLNKLGQKSDLLTPSPMLSSPLSFVLG